MALLDLLGRRWTLRILWELRDETLSFRNLQARCDSMSPSVLNTRLSELRETGVVELGPAGGFGLTAEGRKLLGALAPVDDWAKRWGRREGAAPARQSREAGSDISRRSCDVP
jgi:DNA-binding HxlR family transcriptional regulator